MTSLDSNSGKWKTFIGTLSSCNKPDVSRRRADVALLCLRKTNWFRRTVIQIVDWKYLFRYYSYNPIRPTFSSSTLAYFFVSTPFEFFILGTIIANCCALAAYEPLPRGDTTIRNEQLVYLKSDLCMGSSACTKPSFSPRKRSSTFSWEYSSSSRR